MLSVGGQGPRAPLRKWPLARGHGLLMGKGPRLLMCKWPRLLASYFATSSDPIKWPRGVGTEYDLMSCPRTFNSLFWSYSVGGKEQRNKAGYTAFQSRTVGH